MNKKFNLEDSKQRLILLLLSQICALSLTACNSKIFQSDKDTSIQQSTDDTLLPESTERLTSLSETDNQSISFSNTSEVTDLPVTSDTEAPTDIINPTTKYIDHIGEVIVRDPKYLSREEYAEIKELLLPYGFVFLGYDNTTLLDILREHYSDQSINLDDVGFYQPLDLNDADLDLCDPGSAVNNLQVGYYVNFARYFLSLSNERFLIDDIDKSDIFNVYFREYVEYYDSGRRGEFLDDMFSNQLIFDIVNSPSEDKIKRLLKMDTPEAHETSKFLIYYSLCEMYNYDRKSLCDSYSNVISFIPIAESVDGEYVAAPESQGTYQKLQDIANSIPKCENLDISISETYDDLINSGVDVDLIEKLIKHAGLDVPLLSETYNKADESGARTKRI